MRQSKKKGKKKLAPGGFVDKLKDGKGAGLLGMAGSVVSGLTAEDSNLGQAGGGALQGAAAGAALGPVGMGVGALIGGVAGWLGADKADEAKKQRQGDLSYSYANATIRQPSGRGATQAVKDGGTLLGKRLGVVQGGTLNPISDDAVEVNANNPSQTDSVELQDAFVDNDEIIDRQNRVFSNELKLPSGKSIAKEAKRLEKMKSEDARFGAASERIEQKLDALFKYQEDMKKNHNKNNFANTEPNPDRPGEQALKSGGKIHIKPENKGKFTAYKKRTGKTTEEALHSKDPHVRKMANFAKNAKKWHHEEGGLLIHNSDALKKKFLLGGPGDEDPGKKANSLVNAGNKTFKTEAEHVGYYMPQVLANPEYKSIYDAASAKGTVAGSEDLTNLYGYNRSGISELLLKGAFPQWTPPKSTADPRLADMASLNMAHPIYQGDKAGVSTGPIGYKRKGGYIKKGFALGDTLDDILGKGKATDTADAQKALLAGNAFANNMGNPDQPDSSGLNKALSAGKAWTAKNFPSAKSGSAGGTGLNLNNGLTGLATFAPNVVSGLLQKRLQGPIAPQLETMRKLDRINPNHQLQELAGDFNNTNKLLARNTAQSGNLTAALSGTLAKKLAATNQIFGQNNQLNAMIQGQEANLQQGTEARNVGRTNQYRSDIVDFNNMKQQLTSKNVSNLAEKILMQGRERNMMTKDAQALALIKSQFGDSKVLERLEQSDPQTAESIRKALGMARGGVLKKGMATRIRDSKRMTRKSSQGGRVRNSLMNKLGTGSLPAQNFLAYF